MQAGFASVNRRLARVETVEGVLLEDLLRRRLFDGKAAAEVTDLPGLAGILIEHAGASPSIAAVVERHGAGALSEALARVLLEAGAVQSVARRAVAVLRVLAERLPPNVQAAQQRLQAALHRPAGAAPMLAVAPAFVAQAEAGGLGPADPAVEHLLLDAEGAASGGPASAPAPMMRAQLGDIARCALDAARALQACALQACAGEEEGTGATGGAPRSPSSSAALKSSTAMFRLGHFLSRVYRWLGRAQLDALEVPADRLHAAAAVLASASASDRGKSPAVTVLAYLATRVIETQSAAATPEQRAAVPAAGQAPASPAAAQVRSDASRALLQPVWRLQLETDVLIDASLVNGLAGEAPRVCIETAEIKCNAKKTAEGAQQGLLGASVLAVALLCLAAPRDSASSSSSDSPRRDVLSLQQLLKFLYPHDHRREWHKPLIQLSTQVVVADGAKQVPTPSQQAAGDGLVTWAVQRVYAGIVGGGGGEGAGEADDEDA